MTTILGNLEPALRAIPLAAALVFIRCLSMFAWAPAFSGAGVNKVTRVIFSGVLTVLILPAALPFFRLDVDACDSTLILGLLLGVSALKEAIIGSALGLALRLLFEGVYLAGELISKIGGIAVAGSFDHTVGGEVSPVSRLLFWIALALFIVMGGFEQFIDGFLNAFAQAPIGENVDMSEMVEFVSTVVITSLELALKIAAPVAVSSASVYLTIGFLGRIFPQLNLMTIGFNVNSVLTLAVLALGVGVLCQCFQSDFAKFLESLGRLAF